MREGWDEWAPGEDGHRPPPPPRLHPPRDGDAPPSGLADDPYGQSAATGVALLSGAALLDVPPMPEPVWGDGNDLLWAAGQALIIAGPDGVGKTTLAANLVKARLGLGSGKVLGLPVVPGRERVLLLLMDRPAQAMLRYRQLFGEEHRAILDGRVRIWPGPPPADLARHTEMLAMMCAMADADTCVVDSLKDAAIGLSDDEVGAMWNRARQTAIQAGVQILELHHPRKGQAENRKPAKLDDLYGSRWIPAGAGSVISLWGEPGDPVVDFTHLKPVTETVGPWRMNVGADGSVSREHGVDLVLELGYRREGLTAEVAARLLFGVEQVKPSHREKARRKLEKLVQAGVAVELAGRRGGIHGTQATTWHLKANTEPFTEQSRA